MPMRLFPRILLAVYGLFVAAVVLWPTPVDRPVAGTVQQVVTKVQHAGAPGFTYSTVEISTNVLMFVPLGLLMVLVLSQVRMNSRLRMNSPLPVETRRSRGLWAAGSGLWAAGSLSVVACAALSTTIELTQRAFLPDRVSSLVDVAANTLGGVVGATLACAVLWWSRRGEDAAPGSESAARALIGRA